MMRAFVYYFAIGLPQALTPAAAGGDHTAAPTKNATGPISRIRLGVEISRPSIAMLLGLHAAILPTALMHSVLRYPPSPSALPHPCPLPQSVVIVLSPLPAVLSTTLLRMPLPMELPLCQAMHPNACCSVIRYLLPRPALTPSYYLATQLAALVKLHATGECAFDLTVMPVWNGNAITIHSLVVKQRVVAGALAKTKVLMGCTLLLAVQLCRRQ
eukprot:scaffold110648_cov62-Attheya_sp.AAC.1